MKALHNLPEAYHVSDTFDLRNRKFIIWLNALGIIALVIFLFLFGAVFMLLRPEAFGEITINTDTFLDIILFIVVMAAAIFSVLVLHELIHGLFFWLFSRQKPLFGFKGIYAYATLPGWYFPKNQYLIIANAPLIIISLLGIALVPVVPFNNLWIVYIALIVNASGSIGDLVVTFRLLFKPKTTMTHDYADIITFYTRE